MDIEHDPAALSLGSEIPELAAQVTNLIENLSSVKLRLIVIRDTVQANVDGVFNNPANLNWLNAQLNAMRDEVQAFANGL